MGRGKIFSGLTNKTPENLLLDAGAFVKNIVYVPGGENNDTYDSLKAAGKIIGATKGGGEFSAKPTVRQIEVDGARGRVKGLETIDAWEVYLKATVIETTPDTIKAALGAATIDTETDDKYDVIEGKSDYELSDYIDNIAWVGKLSGSNEPVIIIVYNALHTDGLTVTMQDKNEGTVPLNFYGHFDIDDMEKVPYTILYPKREVAQAAAQEQNNEVAG